MIDLPPFITWNESDRRFELYSEDPNDIDNTRQFYVIQLTASVSISDMNPIFEDTLQFNLILQNGCLDDEITITTDIDDYIYYIAEDTYEPDFIQGSDKPQDKQWNPTWVQSVEGCPVDYTIHTTNQETEVRTAIGAFESDVISYVSTEVIPVNIPWADTYTTYDPFDAVVRVQNSDIETYDL